MKVTYKQLLDSGYCNKYCYFVHGIEQGYNSENETVEISIDDYEKWNIVEVNKPKELEKLIRDWIKNNTQRGYTFHINDKPYINVEMACDGQDDLGSHCSRIPSHYNMITHSGRCFDEYLQIEFDRVN